MNQTLATVPAEQAADPQISINPLHLQAAALFLDPAHERPYCKGVYIEVKPTEQFIVGTDSKRIFIARNEIRSRPELCGTYLLSGEDVKRLRKARHVYLGKPRGAEVLATYYEGDRDKGQKGQRAFIALIESSYPQFRQFASYAAEAPDAPAAQYSADHIADCGRAAKMLGSHQFYLRNVLISARGMGLVTFSVPDAFALIQEIKLDRSAYELPVWVDRLNQ